MYPTLHEFSSKLSAGRNVGSGLCTLLWKQISKGSGKRGHLDDLSGTQPNQGTFHCGKRIRRPLSENQSGCD